MNLSETASTGKGKSFLPGGLPDLSGLDPLAAARTAPEFMVKFLEQATGVSLDAEQKQTLFTVLSELPEDATILDLLNEILGITPEQYEPLAPLFKALQKMQEEGEYAGLFAQNDGN